MNKKKHHSHIIRTIIRIPDELGNEIKSIFPDEKPKNTIGRPVVSYRKVLDGIMFKELDVNGKCYL